MKSIMNKLGLAAGIILCAAYGLSPQLTAKEMVPYKSAGAGTVVSMDINWPEYPDPGWLRGTGKEIGQATHFGQYESLITLDGYFVWDNETTAHLEFTGTFTQVAADGSSVTGVISNGYEPLTPAPTPFWMTFTITSGTGRFEGATGSWEVSALSTGNYTFTAEGKISSIGSVQGKK